MLFFTFPFISSCDAALACVMKRSAAQLAFAESRSSFANSDADAKNSTSPSVAFRIFKPVIALEDVS